MSVAQTAFAGTPETRHKAIPLEQKLCEVLNTVRRRYGRVVMRMNNHPQIITMEEFRASAIYRGQDGTLTVIAKGERCAVSNGQEPALTEWVDSCYTKMRKKSTELGQPPVSFTRLE